MYYVPALLCTPRLIYRPIESNHVDNLKDGLSLKIKNLDIHLYFIATKYL